MFLDIFAWLMICFTIIGVIALIAYLIERAITGKELWLVWVFIGLVFLVAFTVSGVFYWSVHRLF